jgi:hypothetical protein
MDVSKGNRPIETSRNGRNSLHLYHVGKCHNSSNVIKPEGAMIMKTVIGLFQDKNDLNSASIELQSQGFSDDQMHVIEEASQFRNYMDCSYGRSMLKNTIGGAAFIGIIFALIGMAAGFCESLAGMPTGLCIGVGVVLLLLGALVGGLLGAIIGWAEVDRETHSYLAGLEKGHTLMLVKTDEEDSVALVQRIFKKGNAREVQVCTRAHDSAVVQNKPQLEPA